MRNHVTYTHRIQTRITTFEGAKINNAKLDGSRSRSRHLYLAAFSAVVRAL
jgi:hypothetical protein